MAGPASAASIGKNFTASTYGVDSSFYPPDSDGAVGPGQYVELINGRYKVWDKTTGALLLSMPDSTFWSTGGVTFGPGIDVSDPRVIYDPASSRWFASAVDFNPTTLTANRFLVGVSNTSDPQAGWKTFALSADSTNFADFPRLGINQDGVYLMGNMWSPGGASLVGENLLTIPKASLLAGTVTGNQLFTGVQTTLGKYAMPAISNGGSMPLPVFSADWTTNINQGSDGLLYTRSSINGPIASPTLTHVGNYSGGSLSPCIDAPQKGSSTFIADNESTYTSSIVAQGGVAWTVQGINSGPTQAAIRWARLDLATLAVLDTGVLSDLNVSYYFPSIAVNANGDIVIGFSASSTSMYASAMAVIGKFDGTTTTFDAPLLLKAGLGSWAVSPVNGSSRWGDYSATTIDPLDPTHFWTIQEWASATNQWSTQVTEIIVPEPATLALVAAGAVLFLFRRRKAQRLR